MRTSATAVTKKGTVFWILIIKNAVENSNHWGPLFEAMVIYLIVSHHQQVNIGYHYQ